MESLDGLYETYHENGSLSQNGNEIIKRRRGKKWSLV